MPPLLLAALSLVQLLTSSGILSIKGLPQPSALGDAISKIMQILQAGNHQPGEVEAVLTDLLDAIAAAKDVLPPEVAERLDTVDQLLKKSTASMSNLASGQVAQVCTITMSFDGKSVPVDVFAIRQDSSSSVASDLGL